MLSIFKYFSIKIYPGTTNKPQKIDFKVKKINENFIFLHSFKRKFKIFIPFFKLHVIAMKKSDFFDRSINFRYLTIDLTGGRLGQAINSSSESPFKNEGTKCSNMDILVDNVAR